VGTVSRVINLNTQVSDDLRARVEAAIAELGYRPNALARSFRQQRSNTLGLVVPDITAPFFAELAKYTEAAALARGYTLLLGNSMYSTEVERLYVSTLADRRADGLILVPSTAGSPVPQSEQARVVVVDRELPGMDLVASDHRGGAKLAIEYLLGLGHTLIGCVAGPQELPPLYQRYDGYAELLRPILAGMGLELEAYVREGPFDYDFGYTAALSLLQSSAPRRPTALFCSSDQQAIGALRACADVGLDVPADVSITGFDDIPLARLVSPRLTTVRQPIESIADASLDRLRQRIESPGGRRRRLLLDTELVVRASCAPPRRRRAAKLSSTNGKPQGGSGAAGVRTR
jgi:LacI family transcriptional regulator